MNFTLDKPVLRAIIPITLMSGRMENLKTFLEESKRTTIKVTLVHDHRDEETSKELREIILALNSPSIDLIEGQFGSPGAARNAALKSRNSDWVTFWDSDDLPSPTSYFDLVEKANSLGKKFAVGQFECLQLPERYELNQKKCKTLIQVGVYPGLWRWAFNLNRIKHLHFSEYLMGEDQLFLAMCAPTKDEVFISKRSIYTYFQGVEGQLTSRKDAISDLIRVSQIMQNELRKANSMQCTFIFVMVIKQLITLKKQQLLTNSQFVRQILLAHMVLTLKKFKIFTFTLKVASK
jgi:hypothetical protein